MKAIVLAGGYGSRVMPMTHYVPKPMLPVAGRPVIDYAVSRLVAAGITDITFALGYKPEQIEAHVAGYADIRPTFVREDAPLGTAGASNAPSMRRISAMARPRWSAGSSRRNA